MLSPSNKNVVLNKLQRFLVGFYTLETEEKCPRQIPFFFSSMKTRFVPYEDKFSLITVVLQEMFLCNSIRWGEKKNHPESKDKT